MKFVVLLFCLKKGGLLVVYFAFLKSIVPSGVVVTYVKSASMSFLASSFVVTPWHSHSPLLNPSRCRYFCVVSSFLCPIIILTVSAFCVLRSCLVAYACLRSYNRMVRMVWSLSFLASLFLNLL